MELAAEVKPPRHYPNYQLIMAVRDMDRAVMARSKRSLFRRNKRGNWFAPKLMAGFYWSVDASGDLVLNAASQATAWVITPAGLLQGGAGNNIQFNPLNGLAQVYGTLKLGAGGLVATVGNSPTPTAIHAGATPSYSPVGPSLSSSDSTHPTPPTTSFSGSAAGTYNLAAFTPLNFVGTTWWEVLIYFHVTANSLSSTITIGLTTFDEAGNSSGNLFAQILKGNGAGAANIPSGGTGYFWAYFPLVPLTSNNSGSGGASTQILQTFFIAAGTGAFTGVCAVVLRKH